MPGLIVNQITAARHIFVDAKRFRELEDRGVIPPRGPGGYDLDAVREGYCRYMVEMVAGRANSGSADLTAERARLASEQADATAIKNGVARGELVRLADVCRAVSLEYGVVRERMLAIRGKLEGIAPPPVLDAMDAEIDDALDELHEPEFNGDPDFHPDGLEEAAEGPDAPAAPQPRGVGGHLPDGKPEKQRKPRKVANGNPTRRRGANARRDGA